MIINHATLYIREKDELISGFHAKHTLVVVELEGSPDMVNIRDFICERVALDELITFHECTFITAENWATMIASQTILDIMEASRVGWVDDTTVVEPVKSKWKAFWDKGKNK